MAPALFLRLLTCFVLVYTIAGQLEYSRYGYPNFGEGGRPGINSNIPGNTYGYGSINMNDNLCSYCAQRGYGHCLLKYCSGRFGSGYGYGYGNGCRYGYGCGYGNGESFGYGRGYMGL